MFLTVLLLISAVGLSVIAGYYSVIGMTAIFAASWWPIVVMTGTLEFSKVVISSWLYRNWDRTPRFMKIYFVSAIFILMFITSLGIFGFLSKAHIDQIAGVSDNPLFIKQIEQQIDMEQSRITDSRNLIGQLDGSVNSLLTQSTADSAQRNNRATGIVKNATKLRESQKKDRASLNKTIDEANAKIRDLTKEKLKLEQEQIKIEAEVGPIKYIAQMMYGDEVQKDLLEKAVRYVIVMIIIVFDPLALLMYIAANMTFMQAQEEKKQKVKTFLVDQPVIESDPLESTIAEPEELLESKKKEPVEIKTEVETVPLSNPVLPPIDELVQTIVEKVGDKVTDQVLGKVVDAVTENVQSAIQQTIDALPAVNPLDFVTFADEELTSNVEIPEELPVIVDTDEFDLDVQLITDNDSTFTNMGNSEPEVGHTVSNADDVLEIAETIVEEPAQVTMMDGKPFDEWLFSNTVEEPVVEAVIEEPIIEEPTPQPAPINMVDFVNNLIEKQNIPVGKPVEEPVEVEPQPDSTITEQYSVPEVEEIYQTEPAQAEIQSNNQNPVNNRLQSQQTRVNNTNQPNDIMQTIKRYQTVRADDARRTLR